MGLSNDLSCEAGSFSRCLNPHRVFQSEVLSLYFSAPEPWVSGSVSLLSCSSWLICTQMRDHVVLQPPPCHKSSPSQLPVSAPPARLGECFFFISLVVGLPHGLIFCQFWLLFVFKFIVVLLLVVRGGKVYDDPFF